MTDIKRIDNKGHLHKAVIHNGTVYLAGNSGSPELSFEDQCREVMQMIDDNLAKAGTDKSKLLQAIVWLHDIRTKEAFNAIWNDWIPDGCAPARACGQVGLGLPGKGIEITVIAAL